jgi:hypothetical protein
MGRSGDGMPASPALVINTIPLHFGHPTVTLSAMAGAHGRSKNIRPLGQGSHLVHQRMDGPCRAVQHAYHARTYCVCSSARLSNSSWRFAVRSLLDNRLDHADDTSNSCYRLAGTAAHSPDLEPPIAPKAGHRRRVDVHMYPRSPARRLRVPPAAELPRRDDREDRHRHRDVGATAAKGAKPG